MKNKMTILLAFILQYLFWIADFSFTYSNKEAIHQITYTGFMWVLLDTWTIWLYHSTDKPQQWVKYTKTKK